MKRYVLLFIFSYGLYADTGCQAVINNKPEGCKADSLLSTQPSSSLETPSVSTPSKDVTMKITEKLSSVEVIHLGEEMIISREATTEQQTCPPYCIQPMNIDGIKTIGELEALSFIGKLKEKKSRLVIDTRESRAYKKETIPGAINLPYTMLLDKSPYQKKVLELLGSGRKMKRKWFFKHPHQLLIFGENAFSSTASNAIHELIKLGYPKDKILYYRGGIGAWKASGLTLI